MAPRSGPISQTGSRAGDTPSPSQGARASGATLKIARLSGSQIRLQPPCPDGRWQGRQHFPSHCLCLLPPHTSALGPRLRSQPPSGHGLFWRLLGWEQWRGGTQLLEIGKKCAGWFPERSRIQEFFHCHRSAVWFWRSQLPSLNLCFPPSVKYKKCSVHPGAMIQQ